MATSNLTDKARDQLGGELRNLASAIGERAVQVVTERLTGATGRLSEYARQGGGPGLIAAATGAQKLAEGHSPMKAMFHAGLAGGKEKLMAAFGGGGKGGKGGGKKLKVTNIVETIEVGVPVRVAYNQWTTFGDFPSFMKKVELAENDSDEKMNWKAQIFWSHRSWESTIVRQIPDRLIHWRSKGEKGSVDGTVSFHEVGPELTKILVVLEYHPKGLFEHTGNLWRAQGRRVRLELKHFVRHVMTQTVLDPDSVEGWRGEIEDSQVVKDHETALREEQEAREQPGQGGTGEPEEQPEEQEEERRPAGRGRRQPPQRRRSPEDEEYDDYDADDDFDDEEYDEEPDEEEQPPPRRRQPERARRPQREERSSREERAPREERSRRAPEAPRRPVVRRRREERGE
ncbi:SRPBCC family protein [Micromonospora auratinigra]|uniref:Polyketide cyclase / dehydrase and lipid transport n=1 Tax=Micromonospora auratinigra TaxID=261654 RepID=A0A1A8ZWZ0_9ACTN|nr:SRPBCC family protein [Micromonospora auratinigra]SBT48649.1 Polyketide cyclase / dehydrase and lipid transport [Micromonospora auratinigra]